MVAASTSRKRGGSVSGGEGLLTRLAWLLAGALISAVVLQALWAQSSCTGVHLRAVLQDTGVPMGEALGASDTSTAAAVDDSASAAHHRRRQQAQEAATLGAQTDGTNSAHVKHKHSMHQHVRADASAATVVEPKGAVAASDEDVKGFWHSGVAGPFSLRHVAETLLPAAVRSFDRWSEKTKSKAFVWAEKNQYLAPGGIWKHSSWAVSLLDHGVRHVVVCGGL